LWASSLYRYHSQKNPHTTKDRALHLMERQLFVNQKPNALYNVRFQENWKKVEKYFIYWRRKVPDAKAVPAPNAEVA
ncbi:unnamed protein product, partial [Ilex paraguariensis]